MFAAENVRERKRRRGSIGSAVRASHATKPTRRMAPTTNEPTIVGEVQPSSFARIRPHTTASRPTLASPRPGRSSLVDGPYDSFRRAEAIGIAMRPIGTLSQKIHCQARPSAIAPPTSGPIAIARPAIPPHAPSASARRSRGTAADRIVRLSGVMIAPPTPWMARATMSCVTSVESAAIAEPAVKIARPMMKTRFRPNRSPSAAPVRSRTAKVRV